MYKDLIIPKPTPVNERMFLCNLFHQNHWCDNIICSKCILYLDNKETFEEWQKTDEYKIFYNDYNNDNTDNPNNT